MRGCQFFIVCVLLFAAFAAGIYIGSTIAQATARQIAVLDHAKMKAMETEIQQTREEYLAMLKKLPKAPR